MRDTDKGMNEYIKDNQNDAREKMGRIQGKMGRIRGKTGSILRERETER